MATTKVTTDVIDMSGNTGGLTWVKGTTAEQPSGVIGEIREDTDTKRALVYTDETGTSEWRNLKEASVSQTFTADYLIVAGGGGGGYDAGGGGGAGGYLTSLSGANVPSGGSVQSSLTLTTGITYTVTVGAPGAGSTSSSSQGSDGGLSSIAGSGLSTITATGGGGGGTRGSGVYSGKTGGSGGGKAGDLTGSPGTRTASPVQGRDGGTSTSGTGAGGGGGAGAVGDNSSSETGGNGAVGLENEITGATGVFYAAGGGGGSAQSQTPATGGSSIGGNGGGGSGGNTAATTGSVNTGSGGGGGTNVNQLNGAEGGKGVVILRYSNSYTASLGGGATGDVNQTVTGSTTELYTKITGSGTITF